MPRKTPKVTCLNMTGDELERRRAKITAMATAVPMSPGFFREARLVEPDELSVVPGNAPQGTPEAQEGMESADRVLTPVGGPTALERAANATAQETEDAILRQAVRQINKGCLAADRVLAKIGARIGRPVNISLEKV